eukprot:2708426-Heterocapsa_arctica.AAC.1
MSSVTCASREALFSISRCNHRWATTKETKGYNAYPFSFPRTLSASVMRSSNLTSGALSGGPMPRLRDKRHLKSRRASHAGTSWKASMWPNLSSLRYWAALLSCAALRAAATLRTTSAVRG